MPPANQASGTGPHSPDAARRQRQLLQRLESPACYPHPVDTVQRIETHISTLLLAGEYAYKIKKPVRFDFLDYSTLEQRRFFCEEEVRLNRRFAPDLYLGCIAIRGTQGAPMLEGHGEVLEYAVKMRRFAAEQQADHLAAAGQLSATAIDALAATLARYHAAAPRQGWGRIYGLPHNVQREAQANLEQLQALAGDCSEPERVASLARWSGEEAARLQPILAERLEAGFIRECHGDLHLANLILRDGTWSAFDCVEFDAHLRWIDVMNDAAFTLADLHAHALRPLAYRLLNRYLGITGDYAGLAVLRFYMVYRALVRAKILAISAAGTGEPAPRAAVWQKHLAYLHTAWTLAEDRTPGLIITHGVSGSGKSWAAQWATQHYGYITIRSDVERKRLHNLGPQARSHSGPDAGIYTWSASQNTYRRLFELAEYALGGGWRVILDASFLDREQRDQAHALARRLHCPFHILHLATPGQVARQRVRKRGQDDASEAGEDILERQLAAYEPLSEDELGFAVTTVSEEPALQEAFARWEARN